MEEFADVYYVDTRNATRDHRPGQSPTAQWFRPRAPAPTALPPSRTVYVPPQQAMYGQPQPMYAQPQPQVIYASPVPQQNAFGTLLGRMTIGQLVEIGAQLWAALQNLPAAPVATRDIETDVQNMILYHAALATHAKRDEQVRTIGGLVSKLVG